jgi:thiamine pyrophosphate-dependent acetolactate synthase large subunit-like protein
VASGAFHEALNVGALTGAPAVFVFLLQEITDDAPVGRQLAADPMALASAHGWHTQSANPTEEDVHAAVSAARATGGPALVCVRIPHT